MVFEPGAAGGAEAAVVLLRDGAALRVQDTGVRVPKRQRGVDGVGSRHGVSVAPDAGLRSRSTRDAARRCVAAQDFQPGVIDPASNGIPWMRQWSRSRRIS